MMNLNLRKRFLALFLTGCMVLGLTPVIAPVTVKATITQLIIDGTTVPTAANGTGWSWDGGSNLTLNGYSGGAIQFICTASTDTLNIICSGNSTIVENSTGAGIFSQGILNISGSGTLNIEAGGGGLGIAAFAEITISSAVINIVSTDSYGIFSSSGDVNINGSNITIISDNHGIEADGSINIVNGTTLDITVSSSFTRGLFSYDAVDIDNSDVTIVSPYRGIQAFSYVEIHNGSNVSITAVDSGIYAFDEASLRSDSNLSFFGLSRANAVMADFYYDGVYASIIPIIFDSNDNNAVLISGVANQWLGVGSTVPVLPVFEFDNFDLYEWNTVADGSGSAFDETTPVTNALLPPPPAPTDSPVTVYAQWTPVVTFNSNGGTTAAQNKNAAQLADGDRPNNPTRSGYDFIGWNTLANGSGVDFEDYYAANGITAPITFYAQWEAAAQENGNENSNDSGNTSNYEPPNENSGSSRPPVRPTPPPVIVIEDEDEEEPPPTYDTHIHMTVGAAAYTVNDETLYMDVAPLIVDGRTMVPLRVIAEAFGATVSWDDATKSVTIELDGEVLTITIGVLADGMDVPAFIQDGRTMVPLRYISETLGALVEWNSDSRTVDIYK